MNIYTSPISHLALWHGSECRAPADFKGPALCLDLLREVLRQMSNGPQVPITKMACLAFFLVETIVLWGHKGGAVGEFPDVSWHCWLFCELHTGSNHCFLWSGTLIACIKSAHHSGWYIGILLHFLHCFLRGFFLFVW